MNLKEQGVQFFFECTPNYIGRDGVCSLFKKSESRRLTFKNFISHDDGWSVENENEKIKLVPFNNGTGLHTQLFLMFL